MITASEARRFGARAFWALAAVVAVWGLAVAAATGYEAFSQRRGLDRAPYQAGADQWECIGDTADRLAAPDDVLSFSYPDDRDVRQFVIATVHPRVTLVADGGTGRLVVALASTGQPGERCGDYVVRIDR